MKLYSINFYRPNFPIKVYIVKALSPSDALAFLNDHLKNVLSNGHLGMAFFQRHFDVDLFSTYETEIYEILSYDLFLKKY